MAECLSKCDLQAVSGTCKIEGQKQTITGHTSAEGKKPPDISIKHAVYGMNQIILSVAEKFYQT